MTTFTVPRTARPITEDMFADLGVPLVSFTSSAAGMTVTCPQVLTPANIIRGKIRLLTAGAADEATLVLALGALAADNTYLAGPDPTTIAGLAAQTRANTAQVRALILWVGRDVLQ